MSEQEIESQEREEVKKKKKPGIKQRFMRAMITFGFLILFIIGFGQLVPLLMFPPGKSAPKDAVKEELPAQDVQEQKPEEPSIIEGKPEELQPEVKSEAVVEEVQAATQEQKPESDARLKDLEEKIIRLEEGHKKEIEDLKNKFEEQNNSAQKATQNKVVALALFMQLKEAVEAGKPYADLLKKLEELAVSSEEKGAIEALKSGAEKGIATELKLKEQFAELAKKLVLSKDESAVQKILHKFIVIRKTGKHEGDDDESVSARAEAELMQNNLGAAISETEGFSPAAKEIFAEWAAAAGARIDATAALDKLQPLLFKSDAGVR